MAANSNDFQLTSATVYECQGDFFNTFKLRPGPVLGEGVTGPVVLAKSYTDESAAPKAVKIFPIRRRKGKHMAFLEKQFAQEVSIMNALNHPNLMGQVMAARCPRYFAISMKYCPKGSLNAYQSKRDFSPAVLDRFTVQLSCAVRYLHNHRIYHGDIKLGNILLDDNENIVLSDFGHSQVLSASSQMVSRVAGTIPYMAPEADNGEDCDAFKLDAYALGVVTWCMVTNKNASKYEHKHFAAILEEKPFVDSPYREFVANLLQENPDSRWTVAYLCEQLKTMDIAEPLKNLL